VNQAASHLQSMILHFGMSLTAPWTVQILKNLNFLKILLTLKQPQFSIVLWEMKPYVTRTSLNAPQNAEFLTNQRNKQDPNKKIKKPQQQWSTVFIKIVQLKFQIVWIIKSVHLLPNASQEISNQTQKLAGQLGDLMYSISK